MNAYDDELVLAERVSAGAEFMDAIDRDWFWIVDPTKLNMAEIWMFKYGRCGCVLSQYDPTGDYNPGNFGLEAWTDEDAALGFYTLGGPDHYRALTALWREAINERRAAWFDKHPEAIIHGVR